MGRVFKYPELNENGVYPMVFLAGPVVDAPDWQAEAEEHFKDLDIFVANPRTNEFTIDQVRWQSKMMRWSNTIMFWFPKPLHNRDNPSRPYAQTSRFELGEYLSHRTANQVFVGIEPGFSGEGYLREKIRLDYSSVPVFNSFGDIVNALRKRWIKYKKA